MGNNKITEGPLYNNSICSQRILSQIEESNVRIEMYLSASQVDIIENYGEFGFKEGWLLTVSSKLIRIRSFVWCYVL